MTDEAKAIRERVARLTPGEREDLLVELLFDHVGPLLLNHACILQTSLYDVYVTACADAYTDEDDPPAAKGRADDIHDPEPPKPKPKPPAMPPTHRTNAAKNAAARAAAEANPDWDTRRLAAVAGVSHTLIAKVKRALAAEAKARRRKRKKKSP